MCVPASPRGLQAWLLAPPAAQAELPGWGCVFSSQTRTPLLVQPAWSWLCWSLSLPRAVSCKSSGLWLGEMALGSSSPWVKTRRVLSVAEQGQAQRGDLPLWQDSPIPSLPAITPGQCAAREQLLHRVEWGGGAESAPTVLQRLLRGFPTAADPAPRPQLAEATETTVL